MTPKLKKCVSILIVNEVEPCVDFWVNRFGFEKTAEVPHEGKLGFAIVSNGAFEIMYQGLASANADTAGDTKLTESCLYIDVDDIDAVIERLDGVEVVVPKRKTFYGATEFFVREPGGNIVGFAQFGA
jgi:uncharacterized glyoxalase superfamily protein PhnB